jgi:hypothetical protein
MMKTPKELAAIVISAKPKNEGPSDLESCMQDLIDAIDAKDTEGMAQAFEAAMMAGPMDSGVSDGEDT